MEEILYVYGSGLYVNLTNRCPCCCNFCIRSHHQGLGSADSLWLEHDPTPEEVIRAFQNYQLSSFEEVVFCGYGEPFCALDSLLETCRYLRKNSSVKIRINTNGLGDLINKKPIAPLLEGLVDTVSISLNTSDPDTYLTLCHPRYGRVSYDAMLAFARDCKIYVPEVIFSVVDVIPPEDIEGCRQIAHKMGIPLRIRAFSN